LWFWRRDIDGQQGFGVTVFIIIDQPRVREQELCIAADRDSGPLAQVTAKSRLAQLPFLELSRFR
jgi:hypothetical protein